MSGLLEDREIAGRRNGKAVFGTTATRGGEIMARL
jgi:hypothetical protein